MVYDVSELEELTLAYATTIHKSQGSEYPIVVMPFTMSHYVMLQRNLLYTGVTRAKKILVLIGEKKAVFMRSGMGGWRKGIPGWPKGYYWRILPYKVIIGISIKL